MKHIDPNIPNSINEDIERLIVRHLDREISTADQARLAQILNENADARAMLAEYREIDAIARTALRADASGATRPAPRDSFPNRAGPPQRVLHPWFVGAAGAILSAAAVIGIAAFMRTSPTEPSVATNSRQVRPSLQDFGSERTRPLGVTPAVEFADYRIPDYQPGVRVENVYRDLIGIRGSDPNRIFVFEREAQATRRVPVSGDF
ncbi:MAG: hypothetical protein KF841_01145 [Phycisphaerae bacterium]|nr:hypothetical protein [Phycisphaerae bacterium]